MTLPITKNARQSLAKIKKEPVLVVEFEGISTLLGSAKVYKYIEIGQADLLIGNSWRIGGKYAISDQIDAITFSSNFGSTTTSIDFKVDPDKGRGESVASMVLAFLDTKDNQILDIVKNYEMLGRKVRVLLAPDPTDTVFPEDYVTVFRGIVESCDLPAGGVVFTISHPDQKKRQTIYTTGESSLPSGISNSDTTILLQTGDGAKFLKRVLGPDGTYDSSFSSYVTIDNEIIKYTSISGDTLTGCTRAQFGTTAASHSSGANVASFYRLTGNCIDLALKIMLSGWQGYYAQFVRVRGFNIVSNDGSQKVQNAVFFEGLNLDEMYGLAPGDYITVEGSDYPSNNFSMKTIQSLTVTDEGTYVVMNGVSFVDELLPPLYLSIYAYFRSQYDTLPDGMKMYPDEVDVVEHQRLKSLFLNSFSYDFYLKDTIDNGKEFIEQEIYSPVSAYSTPRKARSSVAYTVGPLPNSTITTFDVTNVKNADKLVKKRGIGKNFYNAIIYKFDESAITKDKFLKGTIQIDGTSFSTITIGTRSMNIVSKGLRDPTIIDNVSTRRLSRYAFGAEYFDSVTTLFADGYAVEPSDIVILDGESLKIADRTTGLRTSPPKYYEVISKKINIQNGDISFGLLDTQFTLDSRYGLISPASIVKSGTSTTQFDISPSFNSSVGADEYLKYQQYGEITVRVRTADYGVEATGVIDGFSSNTVFLNTPLPFTPSGGMIMELSDYDDATEQIKLIYGFISNGTANFDDGKPYYRMI